MVFVRRGRPSTPMRFQAWWDRELFVVLNPFWRLKSRYAKSRPREIVKMEFERSHGNDSINLLYIDETTTHLGTLPTRAGADRLISYGEITTNLFSSKFCWVHHNLGKFPTEYQPPEQGKCPSGLWFRLINAITTGACILLGGLGLLLAPSAPPSKLAAAWKTTKPRTQSIGFVKFPLAQECPDRSHICQK